MTLRAFAAVLAGVLLGIVAESIVEGIGHAIFPPPPGLDIADPDLLARFLPQIPLGSMIFLVLSWATGSFVGGWIAGWIARSARNIAALAVGGIMLIVGAYGIFTASYPLWMAILGLLVPIPLAVLGGRLAYQSSSAGKNSATKSS